MNQNVLILGATSGIAQAVADRLAADGDRLLLAGRKQQELERLTADLRTRYDIAADFVRFDALAFDEHPGFIARCIEQLGQLDGVVLAHGYLPDQDEAQGAFHEAHRTIDVNYTSAVSLLEPVAAHFEGQKRGYICGISSVAGDRGRQSNYLYGSAKAGLSAYLGGLRHRLAKRGVNVITIKPGTVDTPMTFGRVNADSPLTAKPERVARDIVRAIRRGRPVVYTPWFWRCIMAIVRNVPERLFVKTKL